MAGVHVANTKDTTTTRVTFEVKGRSTYTLRYTDEKVENFIQQTNQTRIQNKSSEQKKKDNIIFTTFFTFTFAGVSGVGKLNIFFLKKANRS